MADQLQQSTRRQATAPPAYELFDGSRQADFTATPLTAAAGYMPIAHETALQPGNLEEQAGHVTENSTLITDHEDQGRKKFSCEKLVLLWLGIGRFYSCACLLIFMVIFGWGIAAVVVAAINVPTILRIGSDCAHQLLPSTILSIISGALFIILGALWPIAYVWSRKPQERRNFTLFGCFVWLFSVIFFGVIAAQGLELYEHNEYLLPRSLYCNAQGCIVGNCTIDNDYNRYVPMAITASMVCVCLIFLSISSFCLCCARKILGHVW